MILRSRYLNKKRAMYLTGLCSLLLLIITYRSSAQVPQNSIGLNPASLKWNQINTDKIQVVFPRGLELNAKRVASISEELWDENLTLGAQNKKLTIFLHNQTTRPNGLVTPGPFRSEFYTRSPQFNCTTEWIDVLTIHEYQHVKQFSNADRGITKLGRILLGSWTWGGLTATALPRWFFEGDATMMETLLTQSGRGRMPAFHMEYKALIDAGRLPGYEKAGARSYNEFIPDWYRLGYYLALHGRKEYGPDLWKAVVQDAVRYKGLVYPFSRALKKRTGKSTKDLYAETMHGLSNYWKHTFDVGPRSQNVAKPVTDPPKTYTHYSNPHQLKNGHFVAIKSGFDHIPQIITLDTNGTEHFETAIGFMPENPFNTVSCARGVLCWAENTLDPRWLYKNYSVIKTYNLNTGEKKQLSQKSKYFSPEINASAGQILTVEITPEDGYNLVVLDALEGAVVYTYPNPDNLTLLFPTWDETNETVICVVQEEEKHYLARVAQDGTYIPLTPKLSRQLSHPEIYQNRVFFAAAYKEINQIYALDLNSGSIYQLTNSPIGAFMPSISADGHTLIYSEYSINGFQVMTTSIEDLSSMNVFDPEQYTPRYFGQEMLDQHRSIIENRTIEDFSISKFPKSQKLINFHSLLPTVSHPVYELSLLSDNGFGTMRGELGAGYNANEKTLSWFGDFTFAGWYPEIGGQFLQQNRASTTFDFAIPNDTTLYTNFYVEEWKENRGALSVALPLRFQNGHFFHTLRVGLSGNIIQTNIQGNREHPDNNRDTLRISSNFRSSYQDLVRPLLGDETFYSGEVRLDWRSVRNRARRHLNPRFGVIASLVYRRTFDAETSQFFSALGNLYMPGLTPTHSLWFQFGYRRQSILDKYRFPDRFIYPRGYGAHLADQFYRTSINYSLPIAYPDWALGSLVFIQRLKLNAFYDASSLQVGFPFSISDALHSTGIDLTADMRVFRLLDVDVGVRYSYLLNRDYAPSGNPHQFDFLVISISG